MKRLLLAILNRYSKSQKYNYNHICWIKTYFYNFLLFGIKGLRLPIIYIYNNVQIISLGKIIINGPKTRGMIRLGSWKAKAYGPLRIFNYGTMVFNGQIDIWGGVIIENYNGLIEFGHCNIIGENCKLMCTKNIIVNNFVTMGYDTTIMDTDFHFTINTETGRINKNEKEVVIGEGSWISSNCKILKGVRLPKYSIVATHSLLLKDYSNCTESTLFKGIPALPSKSGVRRIFNKQLERELLNEFRLKSNNDYIFKRFENFDKVCNENFFNR